MDVKGCFLQTKRFVRMHMKIYVGYLGPLFLKTQAEFDRCDDIYQGSSKIKQPATAV